MDGVNKFINSSTKPSNDEKLKVQKAAIENAKLVMNDESILAVATTPPAAAAAAATATATADADAPIPAAAPPTSPPPTSPPAADAAAAENLETVGGKSRKRVRRHKPVVRATRKREYKPTIACNKYKMARSIKKKMAARSIKK